MGALALKFADKKSAETCRGEECSSRASIHNFPQFLHFVFETILDELAELGVELRMHARDGRHLDAREIRGRAEGERFRLGVLFIVDDTTLVSDSVEGLRKGLELVYERLSAFGLVVNASKSDAICFAGEIALPCHVCGGREGPDSGLMFCDSCGRACHVSEECAGRDTVPKGKWWCGGCGGEAAECGDVASCAQEPILRPRLPFGEGHIEWAEEVKYLGVRLTADCGLAVEITQRIRMARAAFRHLRPLLGGGRMVRGMRGTFARTFSALTQSVLLHGCEAWALAPGELERLEVVQRQMLRQALPRARRGWTTTSTAQLYAIFRVLKVERPSPDNCQANKNVTTSMITAQPTTTCTHLEPADSSQFTHACVRFALLTP